MDINGIETTSLLETNHRIFEMMKLLANILLDIREYQEDANNVFKAGMGSSGSVSIGGAAPSAKATP